MAERSVLVALQRRYKVLKTSWFMIWESI
jgi:hypothetical protein